MAAGVGNIYDQLDARYRLAGQDLGQIGEIVQEDELVDGVASRIFETVQKGMVSIVEYNPTLTRIKFRPIEFFFYLGQSKRWSHIHFHELWDKIEPFLAMNNLDRISDLQRYFLKRVVTKIEGKMGELVCGTKWRYELDVKFVYVYVDPPTKKGLAMPVFFISALHVQFWNAKSIFSKIRIPRFRKQILPASNPPAPKKSKKENFPRYDLDLSTDEYKAFDQEGGPANYTHIHGLQPLFMDLRDRDTLSLHKKKIVWGGKAASEIFNEEKKIISKYAEKIPIPPVWN